MNRSVTMVSYVTMVTLCYFIDVLSWLCFVLTGYVNEEEVMKLLEPINGSCDKSDNVSFDGKEEVSI